ncbi:hypothetical protein HOY34_16070 [Xinfangfangia sp. D13-10-4-6]|uniref:hypothetical protein n=1 Tax=Pseudogemmobacter hezensis TaxID=2737662 RepID=UPI001C130599|nr:hypothetical protein [Pseudogemmobacter hezensis]NPD16710.1 hypothetical protein [Pseudogemmobacter hezensis]
MKKSAPRARMQGNLDGLCGVYSVVNTTLQLSPKRLSDKQTRGLFHCLCTQLEAEGRLVDALVEGMTVRVLARLLDAASGFLNNETGVRICRKLAYRSAPSGLSEFWSVLQSHVQGHGTGSVLLGLGGKYDHWTSVERITQSRISLLDSDGLQHLLRKHCTIADEHGSRHHVLWPTQTFLLSIERV